MSGLTPGCSGSPRFSENERTWSQLDIVTCIATLQSWFMIPVYLDRSDFHVSFLGHRME